MNGLVAYMYMRYHTLAQGGRREVLLHSLMGSTNNVVTFGGNFNPMHFIYPLAHLASSLGHLENDMVGEKTGKESAALADIDALQQDSSINITVRWPSGLRRQVKVYLNKFPGHRKVA